MLLHFLHDPSGNILRAITSHLLHSPLMKWSKVSQLCPTLCYPMDCSLPGSSVHGIFQARVLEWVAISFSRGYSRPRDRTQVSRTVGRQFTIWATSERHGLIRLLASNQSVSDLLFPKKISPKENSQLLVKNHHHHHLQPKINQRTKNMGKLLRKKTKQNKRPMFCLTTFS